MSFALIFFFFFWRDTDICIYYCSIDWSRKQKFFSMPWVTFYSDKKMKSLNFLKARKNFWREKNPFVCTLKCNFEERKNILFLFYTSVFYTIVSVTKIHSYQKRDLKINISSIQNKIIIKKKSIEIKNPIYFIPIINL